MKIRTIKVRDFNKLKGQSRIRNYRTGNNVLSFVSIAYHALDKKGRWIDTKSFKLKRVAVKTVVYPSYTNI